MDDLKPRALVVVNGTETSVVAGSYVCETDQVQRLLISMHYLIWGHQTHLLFHPSGQRLKSRTVWEEGASSCWQRLFSGGQEEERYVPPRGQFGLVSQIWVTTNWLKVTKAPTSGQMWEMLIRSVKSFVDGVCYLKLCSLWVGDVDCSGFCYVFPEFICNIFLWTLQRGGKRLF